MTPEEHWQAFWREINKLIRTLTTIFWVYVAVLVWPDVWYSKFRFSVQYSVAYSNVTVAKEPHDCDWFRAPIGNKDCHYEAKASVVKEGLDHHGKKIGSYDDGKNWFPIDGSTLDYQPRPVSSKAVSVSVDWEKTED